MKGFSISAVPLDCAALSSAMQNNAAGAFVSFEGRVRDNNEGLSVTALEYEVFHDLALSEGQKVLDEAMARFGLMDASAVHREGALAIGDCAVWIGVTARHRGEAFAACRYVIDEIKHRLPVWKKEHYVGRNPQWVDCQHHDPSQATASQVVTREEYYARQTRLPEIGAQGQRHLDTSRVLIVGVGGLGSSAALALAGAGVGTIGLADHDVLSASNLHRQIVYTAADIGKPKAGLAAARLKALNPLIDVHVHAEKVTAGNVGILFGQYDIVLDCTDNFTAKYLLNDAAVLYGKPVVQASIYRFEGQILTIDPANGAGCLRCLFPEPPAPGTIGDCATAGVLGTVPMLFGALQANESIKYILGLEPATCLTTFDLLSMESQNLHRRRREDCPVCGLNPTRLEPEKDLELFIEAADAQDDLRHRFLFIDVREGWEIETAPLPDSMHMPTSAFDISTLNAPKDRPLLVICAHGVRSRAAARALRESGWRNAYSLAGGIGALPGGRPTT